MLSGVGAATQALQVGQTLALGTVPAAKLLLQMAVGAKLRGEGVAPSAGPLAFVGEREPERVQEQIDSEQRQLPAPAEPLVAGRVLQDAEHALAVHTEQAFCQQDAAIPAIALDLTHVRVQLPARHPPVFDQWCERARQAGQHLSREAIRVSMQAQPHVRLRVGVADEEPAVGGAALERGVDRRPNDVDQEPVGDGMARIDLCVQPFRARRKPAWGRGATRACVRPGLIARAGRCRHLHERHDQLARVPPVGTHNAQLVRSRENLHQPCRVAPLDQVEERLHAQHVFEVDRQLVVALGNGDVAR